MSTARQQHEIVPAHILWPFILLTTLFFAWAVPNNLTDTMLAAFKRIMSLSDSKTAWIQVACYLLGYGCFALPGALFIKRHTYKSGVQLGLGCYAAGAFLFYPATLISASNVELGFLTFLLALVILFAGLSILETSTNSYVYVLGPPETATARLNLAQSFNPFGAIAGVVISQVFVLSQLNTVGAEERMRMDPDELSAIQAAELGAVSNTYLAVGAVMVGLLLLIRFTKMPALREDDRHVNLRATFQRLLDNRNYVWAVVAQFFYVGAQIAVWSFTIRYVIQQLRLDELADTVGAGAGAMTVGLREAEPLAAGFYNLVDTLGLDALLPRTVEQAGASYYIIALVLFVAARFACTALMKVVRPPVLLTVLAIAAFGCCMLTVYAAGALGVYALVAISGCMSLMFPTIYGMGITGLGQDTKIGGAGMVMAIAGAAVLTQIQGIVSDSAGSINYAYWVPALAFLIIAFYASAIYQPQASNVS